MTEPETQAGWIIDLFPGDTRPDRRRVLAAALEERDRQRGNPNRPRTAEEAVRYWDKKGVIPQREWQSILDAGALLGIPITKHDFVRHLKDPAEAAAPESDAA